jgi:capsular polysaccharide biosynthesis protein
MDEPLDSDDEWYESEPWTRRQMVSEVQRIRRRTSVRPIPVLLLAAILTGGIMYKLATKQKVVEAEVVLMLREPENTDQRETGLPVNELRAYVLNRLMPKARLSEIIERHNLFHLRHKLGIDYAIEELKSQMEITIWKNEFIYAEDPGGRSARIGIAVSDTDPDRALVIARDLAQVVIDTATEKRQQAADALSKVIARQREELQQRSSDLAQQISEKQAKLDEANQLHHDAIARSLEIELNGLAKEAKQVDQDLTTYAGTADALAGSMAANGLDMTLSIVDEERPERPPSHTFELIMIGVVVGLCALLGSALLIGAFDSRVHDTDDVERLGLPVLGHVPGFPGDRLGSLAARGAKRGRVPSILRWRSRR